MVDMGDAIDYRPETTRSIFSIRTEFPVSTGSAHPEIKRIVEKNVGQHWAHHTTLRCTLVPLSYGSRSVKDE